MIEMYYDSYLVAYYLLSQDMGCKQQRDFLLRLYEEENEYLHPEYKKNLKGFIQDVLYWRDYLLDKDNLDKEYPIIEKDFKATGRKFVRNQFSSEYSEIDMFFGLMRLRLLYTSGKDYERMKLRTLLKKYGYKRRGPKINEKLRDCILFYHIQPYLKGGIECDIRDIDVDDVITFRIHGISAETKTVNNDKERTKIICKKQIDYKDIIPDGKLYLSRKNKESDKEIKAEMRVEKGKYIVLAGSDICPNSSEQISLSNKWRRKHAKIKDDKLIEDETFDSPSSAATFVLGNNANGLTVWQDKNGGILKDYMRIIKKYDRDKKVRAKTPFEMRYCKLTTEQKKEVADVICVLLDMQMG